MPGSKAADFSGFVAVTSAWPDERNRIRVCFELKVKFPGASLGSCTSHLDSEAPMSYMASSGAYLRGEQFLLRLRSASMDGLLRFKSLDLPGDQRPRPSY